MSRLAWQEGRKRLQFGVVHPFSGHNFELRYWLSANGITPESDIEIVILPPPLMADALATGQIDGYCVGEPWNSVGVAKGAGHIVAAKILDLGLEPGEGSGRARGLGGGKTPPRFTPCCARSTGRPNGAASLKNHAELANMLASPGYLGQPAGVILPAL